MQRFDSIRFDPRKLGRQTALAGMLRGELRARAGLSAQPMADAFSGRPIGVRAARSIAKALGTTIAELAADESKAVEAASAA